MTSTIFRLFLQVCIFALALVQCQQFSSPGNSPTSPRFFVPGSIPIVPSSQQPQHRRVPQNLEADTPKLRRLPVHVRVAPQAPIPPPVSLDSFLSSTSVRTIENASLPPKPVTEEPSNEEDEEIPLISTVPAGAVSSSPVRTPRPVPVHFKPAKPQSFFSGNNVDDEEIDIQTIKPQTLIPNANAFEEPRQHQRRLPTPRAQVNFRPQTVQQLESYDKPTPTRQQFEKPVRTKSESPQKHHIKKPVAQVLRRYREDNADGSITWGFENDDGSYKEETIGNDCVTRGKYGYIDPDGVRREYTYTSGLPCDKSKEEQAEENSPAGYVDYSSNRVVLPNGQSVDLNTMVKNRARKPVSKYKN